MLKPVPLDWNMILGWEHSLRLLWHVAARSHSPYTPEGYPLLPLPFRASANVDEVKLFRNH